MSRLCNICQQHIAWWDIIIFYLFKNCTRFRSVSFYALISPETSNVNGSSLWSSHKGILAIRVYHHIVGAFIACQTNWSSELNTKRAPLKVEVMCLMMMLSNSGIVNLNLKKKLLFLCVFWRANTMQRSNSQSGVTCVSQTSLQPLAYDWVQKVTILRVCVWVSEEPYCHRWNISTELVRTGSVKSLAGAFSQ